MFLLWGFSCVSVQPRFNSKKHWSKVCLLYFEFDFFTSAEVWCFWDNETPVELHAFGFHAEQVWQKFWGEIFRMGFLVALIIPQTASTILSPSEGCSCKTRGSGYIPFSSQNEELAYIRFHNWLTFWVETWIYAKNDLTSLVENRGPKWVWSRVN